MFEKILIANRGEIALRINRACKEMGISTVAVHSTADADAMHVRLADESVCIGPPPATQSYRNIPAIIAACEITGAEAIHPGYGFLSENARFAEIVAEHGITFIGPRPEHIRLMGDKIAAKQAVKGLGIPTVPGSDGAVGSDRDAQIIAAEIGFPVLVKAAAGGGGKRHEGRTRAGGSELCAGHVRAPKRKRRSATMRIYMEKYLERPRHIEVQVLADSFGKVVHLGERDCSLQRRHQKAVGRSTLARTQRRATRIHRRRRHQCTHQARLSGRRHRRVPVRRRRVLFHRNEHAAAGRASRLRSDHRHRHRARADPHRGRRRDRVRTEDDVVISGHAIECRINAENPFTFQPSPGTITQFHAPGGLGVRFDSGIYAGYRIPPYYDSLIGKLIVHGKNRNECLMRLRRSLDELVVGGIDTTIPLFQQAGARSGYPERRLSHPLAGALSRRARGVRRPAGSGRLGVDWRQQSDQGKCP
jgi:acetyl-CoA carboxylase, biotin carboxylase subunit